jgi:hypothetical protein
MMIRSNCWTSKIQSSHWKNQRTRSGQWFVYDWTWHWSSDKVYSKNWE